MTKADQIILDNTLTNKQKYNKLLEMWEQGKNYSQIHTLSTEQYERFAEIPVHLSAEQPKSIQATIRIHPPSAAL